MPHCQNPIKFLPIGLCILGFAVHSNAQASIFSETGSISSTGGVNEIIYSPGYNFLIARNSGSAIKAFDLASGARKTWFAQSSVTDLDLSPSGRFVYAADYGGENIGYGTPASQHYVYRIDLATKTVQAKTTDQVAGRIEAISDNQFVLSSLDQWVTLSSNTWGGGSATQTNSTYWASFYYGDIEYDANSHRILHGSSGSSSQEIGAIKINGSNFTHQEGSGMYGSAQGYGGSVVLSTDSSSLYYGALQVDALDVSYNQRVFPEIIYAATGHYAFGAEHYYDAVTGALLGSLGFSTSVYGLNPNGDDFWAFDGSTNSLRHFELAAVPLPSGMVLFNSALALMALVSRRRFLKA
ncbi:hypothetical protein ACH50O_12980 [Methylomonas sp. 2BW1-5-20]|uniref:hypothetical protein n=1 Tax=Methylomonas sp. 2BW1-5-20 TaxID=3376686 RepID=UPI00404FFBA3